MVSQRSITCVKVTETHVFHKGNCCTGIWAVLTWFLHRVAILLGLQQIVHSATSVGTPYNLTITEVSGRTATVSWKLYEGDGVTGKFTPITAFRMTIRPVRPEVPDEGGELPELLLSQELVSSIDGNRRSFIFDDLLPSTEYKVYLVAYSSEGVSNSSDTVTFTTLQETTEAVLSTPNIQPAEVVLVVLILIAWFCAIALFLHKWGKIRILQPREPRFKHSPKNLDTIKVVKKPTDSVIHKHYTRQLSRTMIARENKRIERMNTMPNIKVDTELHLTGKNTPGILQKKFLTMPVIEMEPITSAESET